MKKVGYRAQSQSGSVDEKVVLEFSESELETFEQYMTNYDILCACKMFESEFPRIEKFNIDQSGLEVKVTPFEYRDLYEVLHLCRPFFLKKEPASFEIICTIFGRKVLGTVFAKEIKRVRAIFEHGEYRQFMQLSVNDVPMFDRKIIDAWLNGTEYHHDPDKKKVVENLENVLGQEAARGVFVSILHGRIKALGSMAYLASFALEEIV